ncbi:MAG TPA: zinc ribbon domain-containing protein [Dissulfurispiraceae bacterium]|nr:zinc ribbon domain-containing protein [Dissulfurispiraceae bacterium]
MPIYEYKCDGCGHEFEKLVRHEHAVTCSRCSSEKVTKKFSVFGMSGVEKQTSSGCATCSSGSCSSCK